VRRKRSRTNNTYPSIVTQISGAINSNAEQSTLGSVIFGAASGGRREQHRNTRQPHVVKEEKEKRKGNEHQPSGSHNLFPSSSNEENLACNDEAARIKLVDGSNNTLEYALPRGITLIGNALSNWKSGTHSTKIGP
jgi:hypothetical protein